MASRVRHTPQPVRVSFDGSGGAAPPPPPPLSRCPSLPASASTAFPPLTPKTNAASSTSAPTSPAVPMNHTRRISQRHSSHEAQEEGAVDAATDAAAATAQLLHAWTAALPATAHAHQGPDSAPVSFASTVHGSSSSHTAPLLPPVSPRKHAPLPWLLTEHRGCEAGRPQATRSVPPSPSRAAVQAATASTREGAHHHRRSASTLEVPATVSAPPTTLPFVQQQRPVVKASPSSKVLPPSPPVVAVGDLRRHAVFNGPTPSYEQPKPLVRVPSSSLIPPLLPSSPSSSSINNPYHPSNVSPPPAARSVSSSMWSSTMTTGACVSPMSASRASIAFDSSMSSSIVSTSHLLPPASINSVSVGLAELPHMSRAASTASNVRLHYDETHDRFAPVLEDIYHHEHLHAQHLLMMSAVSSSATSSSSLYGGMPMSLMSSSADSSSMLSSAPASTLRAAMSDVGSMEDGCTNTLATAPSAPADESQQQQPQPEPELQAAEAEDPLPPISPVVDMCLCPMNRPRILSSSSSSSGDEDGQHQNGAMRSRRGRRRDTGSMIDLQGLGSFIAVQLKHRPNLKLHMSSSDAPVPVAPVLVASALPAHLQAKIKRERHAARAANLLRNGDGSSSPRRGSLHELGSSHHRQIAQKRLAVSPSGSPTQLRLFDMGQMRQNHSNSDGAQQQQQQHPQQPFREMRLPAAAAAYAVPASEQPQHQAPSSPRIRPTAQQQQQPHADERLGPC